MKHQVVSVTEFKAKCLAMLEDIGEGGGTITVTKRGRPLARVVPAHHAAWKSPEGSWIGKVTFAEDLHKMDTSKLWEVLRQPRGVQG